MSRILLGAVSGAVALVATLVWETQAPAAPNLGIAVERPSMLVAAPAKPTPDEPAPDVDGLTQGWMATALARPLFSGSRRPASASQAAAPKAENPVRLTGVMTGPFGNRAIFMAAGSTKPIVVGEGARVGDAVIRSIEPGRVVIESTDSVRTLSPSFAEKGGSSRR